MVEHAVSEQTERDEFMDKALPPAELWPCFSEVPGRQYPPRCNAAFELLDEAVATGNGDRVALRVRQRDYTYREVLEGANRIANVLAGDWGVRPGQRVVLCGPNHPTLIMSWFAVLKVGAVVVTGMAMLLRRELATIISRCQANAAIVAASVVKEFDAACELAGSSMAPALVFSVSDSDSVIPTARNLDRAMQRAGTQHSGVAVRGADPALIAFTSGTTGKPKAAVHDHQHLLAIADTFGAEILQTSADDRFMATAPIGFTYGLGGLVVFPFRERASAVLVESGADLLAEVQRQRVTILMLTPSVYRALLPFVSRYDLSSLRLCVSAGETLPASVYTAWRQAVGLPIVDGIGSTEMLHIFISARPEDTRPGATGRPLRGYRARVVNEAGLEVPRGQIGRLAVQGPTGCRYLDDDRQREYVRDGWNFTGDAYLIDAEGYFRFHSRTDDLIISDGLNVSGGEVEAVLLEHPRVRECAVVGSPDRSGNSQMVCAFVVLHAAAPPVQERELIAFVRERIAAYKVPRRLEIVDALPRTTTGKVSRIRLRDRTLHERALDRDERPRELGSQ
jgi:2-aminobenzoate-CoA ligase